MKKVFLCTAMLVLSFLSALGDGIDVHPDQDGPYEIRQLSVNVEDTARGRAFEIVLFYPASGGNYPLILFNHGFMLRADAYRSYGEHLASHGFVVGLPSLVMDLLSIDHKELALDIQFATDYCVEASRHTGNPLFSLINEEMIGLAGHSLGGKLSLLAAAQDSRICAAALLDPVDSGNPLVTDPIRYPSVTPELMPDIHIPLLILGSGLGAEVAFFSACAPEEENYQRFFEAANPPALEITQLGVGHSQYIDQKNDLVSFVCASGDVPDAWVRESTSSYITAFFLGMLSGSQKAVEWLDFRLSIHEQEGRVTVRRK
jgi:chlorophyllase